MFLMLFITCKLCQVFSLQASIFFLFVCLFHICYTFLFKLIIFKFMCPAITMLPLSTCHCNQRSNIRRDLSRIYSETTFKNARNFDITSFPILIIPYLKVFYNLSLPYYTVSRVTVTIVGHIRRYPY